MKIDTTVTRGQCSYHFVVFIRFFVFELGFVEHGQTDGRARSIMRLIGRVREMSKPACYVDMQASDIL